MVIVARAGRVSYSKHVPEFTSEVQKEDRGLEKYMATLQQLTAHATLLGSYFAVVTQLTNGKAGKQGGDRIRLITLPSIILRQSSRLSIKLQSHPVSCELSSIIEGYMVCPALRY
jgi:hypothetical protein